MDEKRLRVQTRLARAIHDEILFRGFDLTDDLVDENYFSVLSLALGNRRLTDIECGLVSRLGVLAAIGDARIWPLKMARIIGSYGRVHMAVAASFCTIDEAPIGPTPAQLAAVFFAEVVAASATADDDATIARQRIESFLDAGEYIPGFGVPRRKDDERNVAMHAWYDEHVETPGRHWLLYRETADYMTETHGFRPNFAAPIAAIALDAGFSPDSVAVFTSFLVFWGIMANALEGTRESPEVLRRLPDDFVEYVGPAPRKSPRAVAAAKE